MSEECVGEVKRGGRELGGGGRRGGGVSGTEGGMANCLPREGGNALSTCESVVEVVLGV